MAVVWNVVGPLAVLEISVIVVRTIMISSSSCDSHYGVELVDDAVIPELRQDVVVVVVVVVVGCKYRYSRYYHLYYNNNTLRVDLIYVVYGIIRNNITHINLQSNRSYVGSFFVVDDVVDVVVVVGVVVVVIEIQ